MVAAAILLVCLEHHAVFTKYSINHKPTWVVTVREVAAARVRVAWGWEVGWGCGGKEKGGMCCGRSILQRAWGVDAGCVTAGSTVCVQHEAALQAAFTWEAAVKEEAEADKGEAAAAAATARGWCTVGGGSDCAVSPGIQGCP